ncbi:MAG: SPOR domain-containing protein [Christensenellales bacterium]|jgi:hypothetical protein
MQKRRRGTRPYRRVSRVYRQRAGRSFWFGVLVTAGIAAYTALAGLFGVFLADKVFLPLNIGEASASATTPPVLLPHQPENSASPIASSPSPSSSPGVSVVSDLVFPRLDFYALQVGAFSSLETAQIEADAIRQRGACGYILYDVRYRVFANIYLSESEARSVKANLMEENAIDSYIYSGAIPMVELTVTAPQEKINTITAGYEAWRSSLDLMRKLSDLVDKGDMQPSEAADELFKSLDLLKSSHEALSLETGVDDESRVLEGLRSLLDGMIAKTDSFYRANITDTIAFSAAIKYNYTEAIFEYREYISAISAGFN